MSAIEGAFYGFTKRRLFRALNQHRRPGDRLKGDPMQADRQAERDNNNNSTHDGKHVGRLSSQLSVRQIIEIGSRTVSFC